MPSAQAAARGSSSNQCARISVVDSAMSTGCEGRITCLVVPWSMRCRPGIDSRSTRIVEMASPGGMNGEHHRLARSTAR